MKIVRAICAGSVLALSVSACGLGAVVEDINDAIDDAAAQAKIEGAFASAATQVTLQIVGVAMEAAAGDTSATAPAIGAAAEAESMTIDQTVTTEDGGTVTVKGSFTAAEDGDTVTLTLDLDATWSNINAVLEDGTKVATSGSQSVDGTFVMSGTKLTMTVTNKGSMTLDGDSVDFEIVMTYDSEAGTMSYTGTVNGIPVNKTITLPEPEDMGPTIYVSCLREDSDVCLDMTGTNYAALGESTCANWGNGYTWTVAQGTCEEQASAWVGSCLKDAGSPTEYTQYSNTDDSAACTSGGGVWTPY